MTTQSPEEVKKIAEKLHEFFRYETKTNENNKMLNPVQFLLDFEEHKLWMGPITGLKTPVTMLRAYLGELQCDITFDCGLGVENTKLIHRMFSLQPEAFKLYHFVRIWIHIDAFAFKRYMVGLMVLFYLQQKNFLPSVVEMQKNVGETWIKGEI